MSPQVDDAGGSRHRAPGAGVERDVPAAGTPPRAGRAPAIRTGGAAGPVGDDALEPDETEETLASALVDAVVEVAEDAVTVLSRERDEYLDMLRRVQADFENYKKRMLRQQTDQLERASQNLVEKLLPALDAFALTRAHLSDTGADSPEVKALLQASDLVADVLAKEGLERIDDPGAPFDPTVHDAVEHAPVAGTGPAAGGDGNEADAAPTGPVVADVLRPGYRWKGRVIRPAMVRVRG